MTKQIKGYCTLCRSRCGTVNTVDEGRLIGVQPLPGHPTGGALCAKGRAAPEIAGSPRRLTTPLRRTNPRSWADPGWVAVSWEEALDDIATRLSKLKADHGAETVAFAATTPSGTPIVDSIDWIERLIRKFGSPNLVYAVENCGWHKDYAHALTFGRGVGVPDYDEAELIILWGHNPARTWLAQASRVAEARNRGAAVVVIDPKKSGSGQQSDLWLRIRPGSDAALALGAIRHLLHTKTFDAEFVQSWTNAPMLVNEATGRFVAAHELWSDATPGTFVLYDVALDSPRPYDPQQVLERPNEALISGGVNLTSVAGGTIAARPALALLEEHCRAWTPEAVSAATTIEPADLEAFYALLSESDRVAYHSWTGVGQHSNATQTERCIATLYALLGACDRPGGNLWLQPPPLNLLSRYDLLAPEQQAKALGLQDLPLGPPRLGWITARHFCRAVLDADPYRVRALMSFGNNMVVSQADGSRTQAALEALEFYVHVDMFMNPTAELADYVLPANSPWERDALRAGFEITQEAVEYVQFRPRMVDSVGQSRADYEIAIDLAVRLGMAEEFFGGDVRAGWNWHLEPSGLTVAQLEEVGGGIRVPQSTAREKYTHTRVDGTVHGFDTPTRRVELYSQQLLEHGYHPLPTFVVPATARVGRTGQVLPLTLSTQKNGVFVHSSHRHVASLRKRAPDPCIDISADLAASRGLGAGDWATVETADGVTRARVRVDADLHPSVVLADFGWWEDCPPLGLPRVPVTGDQSVNINAILRDDDHDPTSGSVPLRAVACEVRAATELNVGHWAGRKQVMVSSIRRESADVLGLTLQPPDGQALPAVQPGQHVLLALEQDGPARAYSVTRGGGDEGVVDVAVRRIPDGLISSSLHEGMTAGSTLWLEMPSGTFTPPLSTDRPVVLVAGGVGITPFIGYLRALRRETERPRSVLLLAVFRNSFTHPFKDELAQLAAEMPELTVRTWYSRPLPDDVFGADFDSEGRLCVTDVDVQAHQRPLVYLCGAPELMDDATSGLIAAGVPGFDIFREDFHSVVEVPSDLRPARVKIGDSATEFVWMPSDGSILNAAERQGVRLPSGCRVGQCESCAVQVTSGVVAHLQDNPSDDRCLTCIAVPCGDVTVRF